MAFDVPQACRLDEFVRTVAQSGFLQYSSTHTQMSCRMSGREVARVFTPHRLFARKPVLLMPPDSPVASLAGTSAVEFLFSRN